MCTPEEVAEATRQLVQVLEVVAVSPPSPTGGRAGWFGSAWRSASARPAGAGAEAVDWRAEGAAMSAASRIVWTQVTWNPVTGCDRVSAGCDHCYAPALARRLKALGQPKYQADGDPRTSGPGFGVSWHWDTLAEPYRWGGGRLVFVNSMSDLYHPRVPAAFIDAVLLVCQDTLWHTYQVLTKRPRRLARHLPGFLAAHGPLSNVWCGTSIEHTRTLHRLKELQQAPAALRFLSLEPSSAPSPTWTWPGSGG